MGGTTTATHTPPPSSSSDRHCTMMCSILACRACLPFLPILIWDGLVWPLARLDGEEDWLRSAAISAFSFLSHGGP